MEPKLLYRRAQQTSPWRAGTPGRAPRNRQAVVILWRPLCLFASTLCLFTATRPLAAQTLSLRLGAAYATPLVKDAVSSRAVNDSIPGERSTAIELRQKIAPVATLALTVPMRGRSDIEISASVAHSMLSGDDGLQTWDVGGVTTVTLAGTLGYQTSPLITLHAGVGVTRLIAEESGLFTSGNSIKPLAELGISAGRTFGSRPLQIDARLQTHSFGTTTLRENNGGDGTVLRGILQIGTTLWHRRHQ